jgi:AraC-like DNA-binding protein
MTNENSMPTVQQGCHLQEMNREVRFQQPFRMSECQTSLGVLAELPPVPEWKWISVYQPDSGTKVTKRDHQNWMTGRQEVHDSHEVLFSLSGAHFFGFNGKVWKLTPGTVLLVNKGMAHDAIYSPFQPACRDLWLHLRPPRAFTANDVRNTPGEDRNVVDQTLYLLPNARAFAESACTTWDRLEKDPRNPLCFFQLQAAVTAILLETMLYAAKPAASIKRKAHQELVIDGIRHFIEANLAQKLTLETLSVMAGYEAVYFHRLFARYVGESVHQFVKRKRIERAKELLREGYKIVSIAGALGFPSSTYFCRFFKRECGSTPSEWLSGVKIGQI